MRLPRVLCSALAIAGGLSGLSYGQASNSAPVATPPGMATAAGGDLAPKTPAEEDLARFAELDVNRDGWLSGSEANGIRHYDTDGDGEVTQDEFISGRAGERLLLREGSVLAEDIDLFEALDSTGSGYISGVDIERGNVATYDADGNGRVTRQEFYDGRAAFRQELEARAAAAREEAVKRRRATGEPEPAPPLDQVLKPKPGMMIGRVLTPDGKPVKEFTIEFVGYNIDSNDPRIHGRGVEDPNLIGRVNGRDGYYEIRLPDGSFGFAASVSIPAEGGARRFPLRSAEERQTIDYIEVRRSGEGVVKNMIWDPTVSEIKPGS